MNKEQTAKRLKISVRTLQRYMSAGRIAFTTKKLISGEETVFEKSEVDRFKREMKEGLTAAVKHPVMDESEPVRALQIREPETSLAQVSPQEFLGALLDRFNQSKPDAVPISERLMLSREEASKLANLPLKMIRDAIKEGRLPHIKAGTRYRIKREWLDEYIKNLKSSSGAK